MGAGRGKARRAQFKLSSTERREDARAALVSLYAPISYKSLQDCSDEEQAIIDYDLSRANSAVDGINLNPPRPYSWVFDYSPHMSGNKGYEIGISVRMDHGSGQAYAIGRVHARGNIFDAGVTVYRVERCSSIDAAMIAAESLYDETYKRFRATPAGAKAHYTNPEFKELDPLQVRTHSDDVFSEVRKAPKFISTCEEAHQKAGLGKEAAAPRVAVDQVDF